MSNHTITVNAIDKVTHDVLRFTTNKPQGFVFEPGQAAGHPR